MEHSSAKAFFHESPSKGLKNKISGMASPDLASISVRASQRSDIKKGILQSKATLGLDYQGVEKGGSDIPNNALTQSIEVSQTMGLLENNRQSKNQMEQARASSQLFNPNLRQETLHSSLKQSGSLQHHNLNMARTRSPGQTSNISLNKFLKRNEEDEPWAEIAKFNKMLDIKNKLDEVNDNKRKADMQRAYLDQQIQIRASQ